MSSTQTGVRDEHSILPRYFYARDTVKVAVDLLGKNLIRLKGDAYMKGRIVEVEAYRGRDDPASHAYRGRTTRNAPMFGEVGHAYVYFTYGNHHCLNVTAHRHSIPGAILIRAIEPLEGVALMRYHRERMLDRGLTDGPGKLTKALAIDKSLNEVDMTRLGPLYITDEPGLKFNFSRSRRIGIKQGRHHPWRFFVAGNSYVSRGNL